MAHIWINIKSEMFSLMFHTGYEGKKNIAEKKTPANFLHAHMKHHRNHFIV